MSKAKALWELTRLEHGLMLGVAILIGSLVTIADAGGLAPIAPPLALAFLTALFVEASTFALNDYFDFEIDKANGRLDRPLVRGDATKAEALAIFAALFPLGIACSYFVNAACFLIAILTGLLGIAYDAGMKRFKPVGNLYIAYSMAIPFVFGAVATLGHVDFSLGGIKGALWHGSGVPASVYVAAAVAFLAGVGREAMKDAQDADGDRKMGVRSVATMAGERAAGAYACAFYVAAIALAFVPFVNEGFVAYHMNAFYIAPVLATDAMLLYVCASLFKDKPDYRSLRRLSLAALFVGLLGFLAGAFLA
jgi:geranylgeranylglycerol-phosphate geranylgeranyltransferase